MTTYVPCKHPYLPAYQRFGLDHPFMDHPIEHFPLFHNISLVNVNASVNIKLKRLSAQIIVWEVRVGYKQLIDTEQFRCLKWTLFFHGSHKFKNRFYFVMADAYRKKNRDLIYRLNLFKSHQCFGWRRYPRGFSHVFTPGEAWCWFLLGLTDLVSLRN